MRDEDNGELHEVPLPRTLAQVLLTEFLWEEKHYAAALADYTGLSIATAEAIVHDEAVIDEHIVARLSAGFGTQPGFWMAFQSDGAPHPSGESGIGNKLREVSNICLKGAALGVSEDPSRSVKRCAEVPLGFR